METGFICGRFLNIGVVVVDVCASHTLLHLFVEFVCGALPHAVVLVVGIVLGA